MSEPIYLFTLGAPLVALLLIFAMKYFSAIEQARARQAEDDAYRQLAERAIAAQEEAQQALAAIQQTVAELRQRLASVETILKQVE